MWRPVGSGPELIRVSSPLPRLLRYTRDDIPCLWVHIGHHDDIPRLSNSIAPDNKSKAIRCVLFRKLNRCPIVKTPLLWFLIRKIKRRTRVELSAVVPDSEDQEDSSNQCRVERMDVVGIQSYLHIPNGCSHHCRFHVQSPHHQ